MKRRNFLKLGTIATLSPLPLLLGKETIAKPKMKEITVEIINSGMRPELTHSILKTFKVSPESRFQAKIGTDKRPATGEDYVRMAKDLRNWNNDNCVIVTEIPLELIKHDLSKTSKVSVNLGSDLYPATGDDVAHITKSCAEWMEGDPITVLITNHTVKIETY